MASGIVEPSSQGSESSSVGPSRTKLVQRLMEASNNLPAFLNDLLTTQAVVVAGTEAAAFLVEPGGEDGRVNLRPAVHIRPDDSDAETRAAAVRAFQNIIAECANQKKDGAIEVGSPDGGEPQFCLVTLLRADAQMVAVSAVITRCRDLERARQRLMTMQLVAGYFELFNLRRGMEQAKVMAERHQNVLQYAAAVASTEGFEAASMSLCNELANRAGASRVSLGWVQGVRIKVRALSHTEKFDKKQDLVVKIQEAMEECLDQEEPVKFDPQGGSSANVTRCAALLSQSQGGNAVLSVPLRGREGVVGVITLEFAPQQPLNPVTEQGVAVAAEVLAPELYDRHENDRLIFTKIGLSIRDNTKRFLGAKYTLAKVIIALCLIALGVLVFYAPMYHVRAGFQLVAAEPRTLSAPYRGFIDVVKKRPGEMVKQGEELATLKTTELKYQLADAEAKVRAKRTEAEGYRNDNKFAQQKVALAEADEAQAQANLLKEQIRQAHITSPINGVILRGDLMDKRGAKIEEGETMFEIAESNPANPQQTAVEAEVHVADRDINELRIDQPGKLATSSFPSQEFSIKIKRIVPVSDAKDGGNYFKVYATIPDQAIWMHPGLTGEARIDAGKRPLYWIWTHRLTDWIRLKLWL